MVDQIVQEVQAEVEGKGVPAERLVDQAATAAIKGLHSHQLRRIATEATKLNAAATEAFTVDGDIASPGQIAMRQLVLGHLLSACTRDYKFDELSHQQDMQAFRALLIDPSARLAAAIGEGQSFHKIQGLVEELEAGCTQYNRDHLRRALFDAFIDIPCSSRKKMIATIGRRGKALMEFSEHRKTSSNDAGYLTGRLMLDVHDAYHLSKDRKAYQGREGP